MTRGVLFLVALAFSASAHAELWENIVQYSPFKHSVNFVAALAADANGQVAAALTAGAGEGITDRTRWDVVLIDSSGQWKVIDTYAPNPTGSGQPTAIAFAADGSLWVAGVYSGDDGQGTWTVRHGQADGSGWSTVSTFRLGPELTSSASHLVVEGSSVWVSGNASGAKSAHWIVRRTQDNGASWATVDDFNLAEGRSASAGAIVRDSKGALWVSGSADAEDGVGRWVIRKSEDGGSTWATADVYQHRGMATSASSYGQGLISKSGRIILTGSVSPETGASMALVRAFTPAEGRWVTLDEYAYPGASSNTAIGIAGDEDENTYFMVRAAVPGKLHWVVRGLFPSTQETRILDDFSGLTDSGAGPLAMCVDSFGDLWSGGWTQYSDGSRDSLIRRRVR